MNFQSFKEKLESGDKTAQSWPGVLVAPGGFLLLQNQSIVPGWRFVLSLAPPFYTARVYSFETLGEVKEFALRKDGILVAGHNTCLVFEGVADGDRFPVSINYRMEITSFLEGAALWLQGRGG